MKTWVFFMPAIGEPWWSKLCDPRFTHCFMIIEQIECGVKVYIRLEGLTRIIMNDVSFNPIDSTIAYLRGKVDSLRVLTGECSEEQPESFNQLEHMNCVSITKKRLGINAPLVVSPKQLYLHLKSIGYKEI